MHNAATSIDDLLDTARETYTARNPKSAARYAEACAVMPGGNTRTTLFYAPFPVAIAHGESCRLRDLDGHEYVNYLGEYTAGIYGHSHPVIRSAINAALDGGINLTAHNTYEVELARVMCERFPSVERVRFTNSGTEANLMALALAKVHTGRKKVMVFRGGYHGGVLMFATGHYPVNVPHEFIIGTYNDVAEAQRLFAEHGDDLAAVLVEPMLGSGGCLPADLEFLRALRSGTSACGAVLIFDEVMTSRLSPGGMQQRTGVHADLTSFGKYIGGGMTFGAFGGRADLMARFDPRAANALAHAGTFNNNTLTMAAGHAGMTKVFTSAAAVRLHERGEALRERLNTLSRERQSLLQFTGIGSLMTAHFSKTPVRTVADVAAADTKLKDLLFFDLMAEGCYLARRGMLALSLEIGDAECEKFVGAVERFLDRRHAIVHAARTS